MILILSQSFLEPTTEDVIDWIRVLGGRWLRVNSEDLEGGLEISFEFSASGGGLHQDLRFGVLPLSEVRVIWFRRWSVGRRQELSDLITGPPVSPKFHYQLCRYLVQEERKLSDFFFQTLYDRPWLDHPYNSVLNKLDVLKCAVSVGFDIPATIVTSRRKELERFCASHGRVITKPIGDLASLVDGDEMFLMYTSLVESELVRCLPEAFAPSLFQECLDKRYELRVFFLDGKSYAMAIFSQQDPQTNLDFRRYNLQKPNRCVPYRLDEITSARIHALMGVLGLESGSLDLVSTHDGRMVFLEVNPTGQFGMVSKPCNYHLERKVAEYLIARANDVGTP